MKTKAKVNHERSMKHLDSRIKEVFGAQYTYFIFSEHFPILVDAAMSGLPFLIQRCKGGAKVVVLYNNTV